MKLHVIDTGFFKLDGGAMFGVVPKSLWSRYQQPDENNLCTWAMRCLLIEKDDKRILIDTGMGNKQNEKFFSHYHPHGNTSLLGSLKAKGFSPEDITDVVLTHLHFDHCGGAVSKDADGSLYTTFPNATYWSDKEHWNWAINPNAREKASFLKENILPIQEAGQLEFVNEYTKIIPELSFALANGHTEGMLIPHIQFGEETIVFMADLLPSPTHIPIAWVMGYDVRPLVTVREKETFLQEAVEKNYLLFYEHDAQTEVSRVVATDRGNYKAGETGRLEDFINL
ncbi:MBL fold metallo-hydrolase [Chitinophagales bacterium]|nr:MBL fold metallo-hydrolase [Chitinophagales bacterium]